MKLKSWTLWMTQQVPGSQAIQRPSLKLFRCELWTSRTNRCGTVKYYILYNTDKLSYCWWFRNPSITSWYGKCPIIFRILYTCMGKPPVSEKSLQVLWASVGHNVPHETFWEPGFLFGGFLDRGKDFGDFFGGGDDFFFWGGEGEGGAKKHDVIF